MATIKGKWLFNSSVVGDGSTYTVNFTCNDNAYTKLSGVDNPTSSIPMHTGGYIWYFADAWVNTYKNGWQDEAYRTVDFGTTEQTVSDYFLSWLENNAEPIEPEPTEYIEITYADKVFKLTAGQKITFKGGKVMQADIVAKYVGGEEEYTLTIYGGATSVYGDYANYAIKLNSAPTSNDDYDYKASEIAGKTINVKATSYYKWDVNAGNGWKNATPVTLTGDTNIEITYFAGGGAVD